MSRSLVVVALALAAGSARADTPVARPEAIEVDPLAPPPARAELAFESGAPVRAWGVEVDLGYVDRPIVLRSGGIETHPVEHRETLSLGGALGFGEPERFVVDARLPLSHQVGDRLIGLGGHAYLDHWVPGELALGGRLRITSQRHLRTFVRVTATVPTGDDHNFAGEARWTYSTQLVGRLVPREDVVIAATGGILLRAAEVQVGDRLVGDAVFGALGLAYGPPPIRERACLLDQLRITAELDGELGDKVGGKRGPSPVEARVGVIGRALPTLAIGVRVGLGLDDQIGSPRFRAMLEVTWQAPLPPFSYEGDPAQRKSEEEEDQDE